MINFSNDNNKYDSNLTKITSKEFNFYYKYLLIKERLNFVKIII